jgi:hypothetical protein
MTQGPADREPLPNLSTAIVIGIGGSGVQTLGRLSRAVRDKTRPDNTLVDNIHLLGLDAVEQSQQNPELPLECLLAPHEYFNIVGEQPLNAYSYVSEAMQHDVVLQQSWDPDYIPPNEPLTDGLKRSRGLGDLAFEINRGRVEAQIEQVFSRALAANDIRAVYQQNTKSRLPVVIAASACGGTGASGFLHVLHAVHRVARRRQVTLQVYPVVYLPRVFYDSVGSGPGSSTIRTAHKSNAYAFLGELELVLTREGEFDRFLARRADERIGRTMSAQDLVSTVFLVDGQLADGTGLTQRAAYQMAADSLHSLLLTDGNNRLGIEGTNASAPGLDAGDPPQRRAYGSFGAFSITYPGTTYRRFVMSQTTDALLHRYLVEPDANKDVHGARVRDDLVQRLNGLTTGTRTDLRGLTQVRDLYDKVVNLVSDLESVEDLEGLQAEGATLDHRVNEAERVLRMKRPGVLHDKIAQVNGIIDDAIQQSGESVSVLVWALNKASHTIANAATTAEEVRSSADSNRDRIAQAGGELAQSREELRRAWGAFLPIRGREKRRASEEYAEVAGRYADRVVEVHVQGLAADILNAAASSLRDAYRWMRAAESILHDEQELAAEMAQRDDLIGKDAGEPGQMLLVPSDVQPQVEHSVLATTAWKQIDERLVTTESLRRVDSAGPTDPGGRDWLRSLYQDLRECGIARGLLAVGMGDTRPLDAEKALSELRRLLDEHVEGFADVPTSLPASLRQAAERADAAAAGRPDGSLAETDRLAGGLANLPERINVAISFDQGRMRLQPHEVLDPPLEVIAASGPLLSQLEREMTQQNRRFADSNDSDRVACTAARYGLTVGAISSLPEWYEAYRQVTSYRASRRREANQPPPHLKTGLRDAVRQNPLLRPSYSDRWVADLVVKAVAISHLDNAPVTFVNRRFRNEVRRQVVARRTDIVNDALVVIGPEIDFGHELNDWFDNLGRHDTIPAAVDEAFQFVMDSAYDSHAAGDPAPLEQLRAITQQFYDFNVAEWQRLRDLAEPDEQMVRRTRIRAVLADAGRVLLDRDMQAGDAEPSFVGA